MLLEVMGKADFISLLVNPFDGFEKQILLQIISIQGNLNHSVSFFLFIILILQLQ